MTSFCMCIGPAVLLINVDRRPNTADDGPSAGPARKGRTAGRWPALLGRRSTPARSTNVNKKVRPLEDLTVKYDANSLL